MEKFVSEYFEFQFSDYQLTEDVKLLECVTTTLGNRGLELPEEDDIRNFTRLLTRLSINTERKHNHANWIYKNVIPRVFSYLMTNEPITSRYKTCWNFKNIYVVKKYQKDTKNYYDIFIESLMKTKNVMITTRIPNTYDKEDISLGKLDIDILKNFYIRNSYYACRSTDKFNAITLKFLLDTEMCAIPKIQCCCYCCTCALPQITYLLLEDIFLYLFDFNCCGKFGKMCINWSTMRKRKCNNCLYYCCEVTADVKENNTVICNIENINKIVTNEPIGILPPSYSTA